MNLVGYQWNSNSNDYPQGMLWGKNKKKISSEISTYLDLCSDKHVDYSTWYFDYCKKSEPIPRSQQKLTFKVPNKIGADNRLDFFISFFQKI